MSVSAVTAFATSGGRHIPSSHQHPRKSHQNPAPDAVGALIVYTLGFGSNRDMGETRAICGDIARVVAVPTTARDQLEQLEVRPMVWLGWESA